MATDDKPKRYSVNVTLYDESNGESRQVLTVTVDGPDAANALAAAHDGAFAAAEAAV